MGTGKENPVLECEKRAPSRRVVAIEGGYGREGATRRVVRVQMYEGAGAVWIGLRHGQEEMNDGWLCSYD